jgi:hypothetical protein
MAACQVWNLGSVESPEKVRSGRNQIEQSSFANDQNPNLAGGAEPRLVVEVSSLLPELPGQVLRMDLPWRALMVQSLIDSLTTSEEIEVRPTDYAFTRAKHILLSALLSSEKARPAVPPVIGTDDMGGILITWTSGDKYLAAKFGAGPQSNSFIYHEQGAPNPAAEISERNLSEMLEWLTAP